MEISATVLFLIAVEGHIEVYREIKRRILSGVQADGRSKKHGGDNPKK